MEHDALVVLRETNPWLEQPARLAERIRERVPDRYVARLPCERLQEAMARPCGAVLVVGPRQAGKSTLAWHALRALGPGVLFLDAEEPAIRELCRSAALFRAALRDIAPRPAAIFIDEAQHLAEAGLFVKGLVDSRIGCPVLVTGSSSFHLHARTRESLAGRAEYLRLLPFALDEVCPPGEDPPAIADARRAEAFGRHVRFGGYPEAWLGREPERVLGRLLRAFLLRDASDLHRVRNTHAFRRLLALAAGQVGSLVNLSEWAAILEVQRTTVADWLDLLAEAHVAVTCPVFAGGRRAEITSARKLYFVDCGLRNALVEAFAPLEVRPDRGPLLENWVFSELHKQDDLHERVHYWRTRSGAEVDFVIEGPRALVGIEVKATAGATGLSRSSRSFIEAYRPARFLVAQPGAARQTDIGGVPVEWLPPETVVERTRAVMHGTG